jgi:outer membrane protein assembly factor BamB
MRRVSTLSLSALTLCLVAVAAFKQFSGAAAPGGNWSQWRGPEGTGVSSEINVPTEWAADKNIKWKTPIAGHGHSQPIVWGNRIFLTTDVEGEVIPGAKAVEHKIEGQVFVHPDSVGANRKHIFKVVCVDRDAGKILWEQIAYEGAVYDDRHRKGSYAAPTPATDGNYVYAWSGGEGDGLYCYDFKTWSSCNATRTKAKTPSSSHWTRRPGKRPGRLRAKFRRVGQRRWSFARRSARN